MHHHTDRITHTAAFVTPVVEHWLEREIAQWVRGTICGSCTFVYIYIWNRTPFPVCVCVDRLFVCMHKMIMHPIYLYIYLFFLIIYLFVYFFMFLFNDTLSNFNK